MFYYWVNFKIALAGNWTYENRVLNWPLVRYGGWYWIDLRWLSPGFLLLSSEVSSQVWLFNLPNIICIKSCSSVGTQQNVVEVFPLPPLPPLQIFPCRPLPHSVFSQSLCLSCSPWFFFLSLSSVMPSADLFAQTDTGQDTRQVKREEGTRITPIFFSSSFSLFLRSLTYAYSAIAAEFTTCAAASACCETWRWCYFLFNDLCVCFPALLQNKRGCVASLLVSCGNLGV